MPHHIWGDTDFDWDGLNDALHIIWKTCRWARLGAHVKEKYGSARVTPWFWDGSLHSLLYPGYVYCQYKDRWFGIGNILWWCDIYLFPKIAKWTGLLSIIFWIQKKVYNLAFQRALKKHPHIRDEILADVDFHELIDGGEEVHNKYWTRVE